MQERRLMQDDDRGLGQGVLDNKPVLNIFKILLENRESCRKLDEKYPAAYLTTFSYLELQKLLHPVEKFIFTGNDWSGLQSRFGENHESAELGMELVALRNLPHIESHKKQSMGVIVHRTNFEECTTDSNRDGTLNIRKLLGIADDAEIHDTLLTLLNKHGQISSDDINFCPMDTKAFIISR